MNKADALKVLKKTQKNYEKIALEFAKSRANLWADFDFFKNYIKEGDKILDLGCGSGRLLDLLSSYHVIDYIGIDYCQGLIDYAQSKYPSENFIKQDLLNLNLQPNSFDLVFAIASFNHFPEPLQNTALYNLKKSLKSGGYLLMTNWNLWGTNLKRKSVWKYYFRRLFTSSKKFEQRYGIPKKILGFKDILTTWRRNGKKGYLYYYAFTVRELKKLAQKSGFNVVEAFYAKNGKKVRWWQGGNIVMICRKGK